MPTWGRPPSPVRPSEARHEDRMAVVHVGRVPSPVRRSEAPHNGSDLSNAHVGTAALTRPAERSSAQWLWPEQCPRGDGRPRPSGRAKLGMTPAPTPANISVNFLPAHCPRPGLDIADFSTGLTARIGWHWSRGDHILDANSTISREKD